MSRFLAAFFLLLTFMVCQAGCSRTILHSARQDATSNIVEPNTIGYYLPKGLIKIKLSKTEQSGGRYLFSCESEIVPDPSHFYTLHYNHSIFSSDSGVGEEVSEDGQKKPIPMKIAVDEKGLLQSISARSEDKTRDVIKTLVEALSLQKGEKKYPGAAVSVPKSFMLSDVIELSFDPDDAMEIKRLNQRFAPLGIVINARRLAGPPPEDYYGSSLQRGIYYRPCLPYLVTISHSPSSPPEDNYVVNPDGSVELHFNQALRWEALSGDIRQRIEDNFVPQVWQSKGKDKQLEKVAQDVGLVKYTGDPNVKNYYIDRNGYVQLHFGTPSISSDDIKKKIEPRFRADTAAWVNFPNKNKSDLETIAQNAGLGLNAPFQGFLITKVFQLPNKSPVLSIDVTRSAFVKKDSELTFTDGILSNYKIAKPSEVKAGLDIPLEVARALVALPTNLIQFQIDTTQQHKDLAKAELERLKAEKALLGVILKKQQLESVQTEEQLPGAKASKPEHSAAPVDKTLSPDVSKEAATTSRTGASSEPTPEKIKQALEAIKREIRRKGIINP